MINDAMILAGIIIADAAVLRLPYLFCYHYFHR